MPKKKNDSLPCQPRLFEIVVNGKLEINKWEDWFQPMQIKHDEGVTRMIGQIDQARLHGIFKQIRDLGLVLVAVRPVDRPIKDCVI